MVQFGTDSRRNNLLADETREISEREREREREKKREREIRV